MGTPRYSTLGWLPSQASEMCKLNPHGTKFPQISGLIACSSFVSDKKFPVYGNRQNPSNHRRQTVATPNYPSDVKNKLVDEERPLNGYPQKFESKSDVQKANEEKTEDSKPEEMSSRKRRRKRQKSKNKKREKNQQHKKEAQKNKEPHDKHRKKDSKPWHKNSLQMEISLDLNIPCNTMPETSISQSPNTRSYTVDIFSLINNNPSPKKHKQATSPSNMQTDDCENLQNNNWFRYRCRVPSVCESEDSFIVFDETSECDSNGSEDLSDSEDVSDSTADIDTKKVCTQYIQ